MKQHLTTPELAERWACSTGWITNLRSVGGGPAYLKLGAKVLYPIDLIREYEASRLVAAGA